MTEDEHSFYRLWHISEDSGAIKCDEVPARPLTKAMLLENDTFILEMYDKIYVWQGRHASTNEKHACMNIANKYRKEWKKPAGTTISRLPQGTEDALFLSYFEGFYANDAEDFGKGKDLDLTTSAKQDVSKLANKHMEAAKLVMDKLGSDFTVNVYVLEDNLMKPVKIEDPAEHGKFFADNVYVVDVQGKEHRYMIVWQGPKLGGDDFARTAEAMDILCNHELGSDMSRSRIN